MHKKLFVIIGLILCICSVNALTNCNEFMAESKLNQLSIATASSQGFASESLALIDKFIESDIQNGFPSAELIIIRNNHIIKHTVYGYAQKYTDNNKLIQPIPLQCNTLFDLASNTKMYATNYAIMHLVSLGKLDIDQPIHNYIPEYIGCDNNGQCRDKRTIRDLLTHSAGYMPDPQFFSPRAISRYGESLYSQESSQTKKNILTKLPFATARGGNPVYSDVDFMLLGILVERITGVSLDKYVQDNIYLPLNLHNTSFNPLLHGYPKNICAATEIMGNTRGDSVNFPNIRTHLIQCQVHDEKAYYSMGGVSGHAGLFSTGHDLAILTALIANNGTYAGIAFWNESTERQFIAPLAKNDTYGLGWRRSGESNTYTPFGHYASNLAYGHTGWTGTVTLIDPKYNLTIILLTNKKHSIYKSGEFAGDKFATGKYYPVIDLVYQSIINH